MKLVVGLGNPGKEYEYTRHNIGFMFLDNYVEYKFGIVSWSNKFNSLVYENYINNEKVIFLKPLTFMNLSGNAVKTVCDYYDINYDDIIVVSDDLDLKIGNFKLKSGGSSGGHNGLKDICNKLKTNEIKRCKIGISNDKSIDTKDFVLGKINNNSLKIYKELFLSLYSIFDEYFLIDFSILMSKYNKKNR